MLEIKKRLKGKQLTSFTEKWDEYKKEQKNSEQGYFRALFTLEVQYKDGTLLNLINEILEIARNN
jgi:hypothetical protein